MLCQETGCAQRYLAHDALNALAQVCARIDDARGSIEHRARFARLPEHVQANDLALGIAMTDAKGDRSRKPHQQANPDTYVHIVERTAKGIVISGTKAIVTGAPYMHEFLVMPCRHMGAGDADFASAARCRSTPRASRSSRDPRAAPARRSSTARRCSRTLRPVHRRGDVRPCARAVGARVLRRRVGALVEPDLRLRHAPPPQLHRRARRLRRPADRRGGADVRGQRLRPGGQVRSARPDGRTHQDRRRLLRVRRGGERVRHPGSGQRHVHARPGVRQHRQAAARHADLRHAPPGARGVGRADRHAARARTRTTTRPLPPRWPTCCVRARRCRTTSASRSHASSRT